MGRMLNKELLDMMNPKDLEISKLKQTIEAFKKYDKKRNDFIQKLQWELEDVSQKYVDLKKSVPADVLEVENKYKEKIKNLRQTVAGQHRSLERLHKIKCFIENKDLIERAEEVLKNYTVVQLKEMNNNLQREIENLRKTNNELVYKLVQLNKTKQ